MDIMFAQNVSRIRQQNTAAVLMVASFGVFRASTQHAVSQVERLGEMLKFFLARFVMEAR